MEELFSVSRDRRVRDAPRHRIASSGGAITPIACDVRTLEHRVADGLAPIQNEYEVMLGGDQLYWIEKNVGASSTTWTIRHAAK